MNTFFHKTLLSAVLITILLCTSCQTTSTEPSEPISQLCKKIEKIEFTNEQYKVYGDINMASYKDNVFFLARGENVFTPELWKYNVSTKTAPQRVNEASDSVKKGTVYYQVNVNEFVFLQLFARGTGMVAMDIKNERVQYYPSELNLLYSGYSEAENMLVFSSYDEGFRQFWGFDVGTSIKPYKLGASIPRSLINLVRFKYLLPDAIVVTGKQGNADVTTYLIPRSAKQKLTPLKSADGRSVRLLDYAFTAEYPYFVGGTEEEGFELWRLNVEDKQLHLVSDINAGIGNSYPYDFTKLGDHVYFWAFVSQGHKQLLSLNVTKDEPPVRHTNFQRTPLGSFSPSELALVDDTFYFQVTDSELESALWSYTPGEGNTPMLVHDFDPGVLASHLKDFDGKIISPLFAYSYKLSANANKLFVAVQKDKQAVEFELWQLDPACAG